MNLLVNAINNAVGDWFSRGSPGNVHHSHVRTIYVEGNLDGGTVTIQASHLTDPAAPAAAQIHTVTTITAVQIPVNISIRARQIRAKITGAGGSCDATVIEV